MEGKHGREHVERRSSRFHVEPCTRSGRAREDCSSSRTRAGRFWRVVALCQAPGASLWNSAGALHRNRGHHVARNSPDVVVLPIVQYIEGGLHEQTAIRRQLWQHSDARDNRKFTSGRRSWRDSVASNVSHRCHQNTDPGGTAGYLQGVYRLHSTEHSSRGNSGVLARMYNILNPSIPAAWHHFCHMRSCENHAQPADASRRADIQEA
mmetsp:Transcript_35632/g.90980  ORF Transcript_35632/g.90980 Transcript_35632/m.90980 type:complete len:208 (+) Transcript_35632:455-1078(+)